MAARIVVNPRVTMQTIDLDGSGWRSERDFYDALAKALGSVGWHGRNANACEETMIYYLELNQVQPPYQVVIQNPYEPLRPFLNNFAKWIAEARQDRSREAGWGDVEVSVRVV